MPDSTSRGIVYPVADDYVKNQSTQSPLVEQIETLAQTADLAIDSGIEEARAGSVVLAADAVNVTSMKPGVYYPISAAAARAMGLPTETAGRLVRHEGYGATPAVIISWIPADGTGNIWSKTFNPSAAWDALFTGWSVGWSTGTRSAAQVLRTADVPDGGGTELPAAYYTFVTSAAASAFGMPRASQGDLLVSHGYNGTNKSQSFYPTGYPAEKWVRVRTNNIWGDWVQQGASGGATGGAPAAKHDIKHNLANRVWGTVEVPSHQVGVALIFDHGTNIFNEEIYPKLRSLGMTATIALNSHMYDPSQPRYEHDNRTSWSDVSRWWDEGGIEIANHGTDHKSTSDTDYDELEYTIAGGLRELEDNLPGVPIVSWVNAAGVGPISDLADYYETLQGQVIHQSHAFATGAITKYGYDFPLNGSPVYGQARKWVDTPAGIASAKTTLASIDGGRGIIFSAHPEIWGIEDNSTVQDILDFLDWLKANDTRYKIMTFAEINMAKKVAA